MLKLEARALLVLLRKACTWGLISSQQTRNQYHFKTCHNYIMIYNCVCLTVPHSISFFIIQLNGHTFRVNPPFLDNPTISGSLAPHPMPPKHPGHCGTCRSPPASWKLSRNRGRHVVVDNDHSLGHGKMPSWTRQFDALQGFQCGAPSYNLVDIPHEPKMCFTISQLGTTL